MLIKTILRLDNLASSKRFVVVLSQKRLETGQSHSILAPNKHQLSWCEGGDKPLLVVDAQLGDLNETTSKHAPQKAQNTQQSTKDWLIENTSC